MVQVRSDSGGRACGSSSGEVAVMAAALVLLLYMGIAVLV